MFFYNTFLIMAKSTSGGTRAMLRGRVASDVYSIGKTSTGKRQQIVRSLAEQVRNPQTIEQMRGRMIMSTVMQAVSALKPIIDHSFDGFPAGQPSISEFIRRNYALIKADVAAHPASGNSFALNSYKEKGCKKGQYIVSYGDAVLPSSVTITEGSPSIQATLAGGATIGDLRSALGLSINGDYITLVSIDPETGEGKFLRISIDPSANDSDVITAENIQSVIVFDGNIEGANDSIIRDSQDSIIILQMFGAAQMLNSAVIYSKKTTDGFVHSTSVITTLGTIGSAADVVLPTYPIGTEMFLNGGDL